MQRTTQIKQLIFSILFPIFALLLIQVTYKFSCYFLIVPIFMSFFIAFSFFQKRMREKICFRNCFIKEDTFLAKIITSPYLTLVIYSFISLIYTISIIYTILSFTLYTYLFLAIFIGFIFVLYHKLLLWFSKIIHENHLEIFVKELTIKTSSFILFTLFTIYFIFSFEPSYITNSLEESLALATNYFSSNCQNLEYILRLKAELDTYFWHISKQSSQILSNQFLENLVWILFIVINAISVLALCRFIVQTICLSSIINKEIKADV